MSEQEVFDRLKYRIEVGEYSARYHYNGAGKLHREDGPAVEWVDGSRMWHQNDQLHRIDGPAVEWSNGAKFWYIYDRQLTEVEFDQAVRALCAIRKSLIG